MAKNSNQRADSKNPNNPASKAAADNRSVQLNPNQTPAPNAAPAQSTNTSTKK